MNGKLVGSFIVVTALIFGAVVYYYQEYGYYVEVAARGDDDVMLTSLASGRPEPILYSDFKAVDADSSPIRYRACFIAQNSIPMLTETYQAYPGAEPLVGPRWFDCFDAQEIGQALEQGDAVAFLGTRNVHYGVDRVIAVLPDGRGFAWHQINHCGEVVFDGKPAPADCPPQPQSKASDTAGPESD
ncbi:MAG: DUF6446 family protein [Paracoccaceae bacterium]